MFRNFLFVIVSIIYLSGCSLDIGSTDTPPEEAKSEAKDVTSPLSYEESVDSVVTYYVTIHPPKHFWLKPTSDTVRKVLYIKKSVPKKQSFEELAVSVRKVYSSLVGVRELTGHNDGPVIEEIIKSVGLNPKGKYPYCSAGVHYSLALGGVPNPITGYSPSALNKKNLVYWNHKFLKKPHFADVVVFYYANMGRIGHAAFFDKDINGIIIETVEFNTSVAGEGTDREGGGIARKRRTWHMVYGCSRWIPE